MKKVALFVVVVFFALCVNAQHVFNKGDIMFNAGIGGPNNYGVIPTLNFSGEVGVIPTGDIGLVSFGGLAEFQFAHDTYAFTSDNDNFVRLYVGPRAVWHVHAFNSDVFDAYGGVGAGILVNGKGEYRDGSVEGQADIFVGGRWMFGTNMGLFAEVGYTGLSFAKFGITFGM